MNAQQHATENLTVHHKVKDYGSWRTGYDAHEKSRVSQASRMGECSAAPKTRMMWWPAGDVRCQQRSEFALKPTV